MKVIYLSLTVLIVFSVCPAEACIGKGRHCRRTCPPAPCPRPASTVLPAPMAVPTPVPSQQTTAYTPAAAPLPAQQPPAVTSNVQPSYDYQAGRGERPAYYYTYNDSGKLIVRQWMDWVFRGGKEAGMPRPPLPVIGWFQRP